MVVVPNSPNKMKSELIEDHLTLGRPAISPCFYNVFAGEHQTENFAAIRCSHTLQPERVQESEQRSDSLAKDAISTIHAG
jgi:hypothetical protein